MSKKRKGTTLMEVILVIVILGIIWAAAANANTKNITRSKISATVEEAQLFASDMDAVLAEIGIPDNSQAVSINEFLSVLEQDYLNFSFDRTTLKLGSNGFTIMTLELRDGFGQPFMFYASTSSGNKRILFASSGADLKFESSSYHLGIFGDDIIAIVKERF